MNKVSLAAVGFGLLALAACGRGDQDQLDATETNAATDSLEELSDDAANVAAEAQALENSAANLEQEAENAAGPQTPADENIAGM